MQTSFSARAFVTALFFVLGVGFIAETALMYYEFRSTGLAFAMASFDAELFIFFPTAGIAALFAFWRAGCVVTDAYWRRVRLGKLIYVAAFLIAAAGAFLLSDSFRAGADRSWWEIAPSALMTDAGEPPGCEPGECSRAPIIDAHQSVRAAARDGGGLARFSLSCETTVSSRFSAEEADDEPNYCFAAGEPLTRAQCCAARQEFREAVAARHAEAPSRLYYIHLFALPMKIFFLFMLLGIGVMLVRRRRSLEFYYGDAMEDVERALPIGGALMLIWPLMNNAYVQSWDLLFGAEDAGSYRVLAPLYMLGFAGWAMVMMFYYFRRYPDTLEFFAKASGVALAAFGIFQYEQIISYINAFLGAGADVLSLTVFAVAVVFFIWQVFADDEDPAREGDAGPPSVPSRDELERDR